jgi:hypothetical protein
MINTERANATASAGASLAKSVDALEGAKAEGQYHAVCMGPKEEDRVQYVALRDYVAELEAKGLIYRLLQRSKITAMRKALEAFPLEEKWRDTIDNVVCTVGKNVMLDAALAGSSYSVVGPYMGLIGAVSYTGVPLAADTMASHGSWTEAGTTNAPTYTGPRKTCAWSAASAGAKALSSALSFAMTGAGTAKGCFIVYFTGAVSTIDNTSGTLYSAGLFTGGDKVVASGDTLNVSYTTSL